MARNSRIPAHIRKEINRIGPGRYVDPSNGRVYIDSADMDGAFEKMQDDVRHADEARDALRKLDAQREEPPPEVQAMAAEHLMRHAQRLEDSGGWQDRAKGRKATLEGKRRFKQSIGSDLDQDDLDELAAIEAALENDDMGHKRIPHLPSRDVVTGKLEVFTDPDANLEDRIQSGKDLVEAIDHHGASVPLPEGMDRAEFETSAPKLLESLLGIDNDGADEEPETDDTESNVTPDGNEAEQDEDPVAHDEGEREAADAPSEGKPEANPPREVVVTLHKGPLDGLQPRVPTDWTGGLLFCRHDPEGSELIVATEPLAAYPHHVYRCPPHVGEPPVFTADAIYDRTESGNVAQPQNEKPE